MTPTSPPRILAMLALSASVFAGCGSNETVPPLVDTTPPNAPSNLAIEPDEQSLTVTWSENSEIDLAGYVLERSLDHEETWEAVSDSALASAEYVDVRRSRADYRVAAVDLSENQSAFSNTATYLAPTGGGDGKLPRIPL